MAYSSTDTAYSARLSTGLLPPAFSHGSLQTTARITIEDCFLQLTMALKAVHIMREISEAHTKSLCQAVWKLKLYLEQRNLSEDDINYLTNTQEIVNKLYIRPNNSLVMSHYFMCLMIKLSSTQSVKLLEPIKTIRQHIKIYTYREDVKTIFQDAINYTYGEDSVSRQPIRIPNDMYSRHPDVLFGQYSAAPDKAKLLTQLESYGDIRALNVLAKQPNFTGKLYKDYLEKVKRSDYLLS